MYLAFKIFISVGFLSIFIALAFGFFRTWKTQSSPDQELFLKGKVPSPLPDGFYKGTVAWTDSGWRGKVFDETNHKGINRFGEQEKYTFKTYVAKGLRDKNIDVLKLDYNESGDNIFLRLLLDEIVETSPGKYLGKIHLRLIPGLSFTLGYFRLEK